MLGFLAMIFSSFLLVLVKFRKRVKIKSNIAVSDLRDHDHVHIIYFKNIIPSTSTHFGLKPFCYYKSNRCWLNSARFAYIISSVTFHQ